MMSRRYAVGIDIGGTKLAIGLVATDGRVLHERTLPTESWRGPVDATKRIVGAFPGWEKWNIVDSLSRTLELPVWLENDADAAALGELKFGAGHGVDCLATLTIGTGFGGAVIIDREILRGARGERPEIGHILARRGGGSRYCGGEGCLEFVVSGPALASAARHAGFENVAALFEAGAKGDSHAERILAEVREAIATATWTVAHAYLPARILFGGGMMVASSEFFLGAAREALRQLRMIRPDSIEVAAAQLGHRAGMIGAAARAFDATTAQATDVSHSSQTTFSLSP